MVLLPSLQQSLEDQFKIKGFPRTPLIDTTGLVQPKEDFELDLTLRDEVLLRSIKDYYSRIGFDYVPDLDNLPGSLFFRSNNSSVAVHTTVSSRKVQVTSFELPALRYKPSKT